ncbi:MAG: WecB/TagA/CpsF family glycosyltransferase [Bacteroidota bacterium]
MKEALEGIRKRIDANQKQTYYFINPHAANIAQRDVYFKSILEKNEWNFPDGIGLKLAGFIEGYRLKENLNGTDLFPGLMEIASDSNFSVYFLGAEESVLKALLDRTKSKWPQLHIAGSFHGYFDKENDTANVVQKINDARADLLLVSFGMPLQEKWIDAIEEKLKVKAIFATGGLFDFYSGTKKRAPEYLRQIGMEWLYRLYIEPGRMWKRYIIGNPLFLANVIRNKYLNY